MITLASVLPLLPAAVIFIFGAIVGSFLNVCIVRLPRGESLVSPPSHCRNCKTPIPPHDNIPLLSYIFLGGRCRFCGERIAPRYFIVELLTAVAAIALFRRFGIGLSFLVAFVFVAALIVVTFIDLDVRIVPDVISLPGIGLGLILSIANTQWPLGSSSIIPTPLGSLLGVIIGGGSLLLVAWVYHLLTGIEGMGGGDIKLLAMIGAFLGWESIPVALFFGSLTGSLAGLGAMLKKGVDSKYALPFAPFLCLGALIHLFFGERLIALYFPPG